MPESSACYTIIKRLPWGAAASSNFLIECTTTQASISVIIITDSPMSLCYTILTYRNDIDLS